MLLSSSDLGNFSPTAPTKSNARNPYFLVFCGQNLSLQYFTQTSSYLRSANSSVLKDLGIKSGIFFDPDQPSRAVQNPRSDAEEFPEAVVSLGLQGSFGTKNARG